MMATLSLGAMRRARTRGRSTALPRSCARAPYSSAVDWDSHFTASAKRRRPSPIRALQPMVALPGMISLGGGMPNPALFPFAGITFTLSDGVPLELPPSLVNAALQYSATPGLPELCSRLHRLQVAEHGLSGPRAAGTGVAVVPGSQDGLAKLFDALVGPDDAVLVEAPTYSGSLAYLQGIGCSFVGVPTDASGLDPEALDALLAAWSGGGGTGKPEHRIPKKPRVLYTIPTGGNPTGASMPLARRRRLLAVARTHDLVVIEGEEEWEGSCFATDDPYYFLSYAGAPRLPSLLSLDEDGRVVRCDSLSKVLSAGLRVGFVTGPHAALAPLLLHNQASIMHTSGLAQAAVLALFRHWRVGDSDSPGGLGGTGLDAHLERVRAFYGAQCAAFVSAIDEHLHEGTDGSGPLLVEYTRPDAGMFMWLRMLGIKDTDELISHHAMRAKVLLVPGRSFFPPGHGPVPFARAAFSTATHAEMRAAMQRLGGLLRELRGLL